MDKWNQLQSPAKRQPAEVAPVIRLLNRFACISLAGYSRCLWAGQLMWPAGDRLNFRARQAAPLGSQAPSGRLDREAKATSVLPSMTSSALSQTGQ